MRVSRRCAAPILGAVLALAAVAPAFAADPSLPPGVVLDATVTIMVVDDSSVVHRGVDHADVELTASRDGVILVTATAQTDPTGAATITGLPRSTGGAPVLLDITANRADSAYDEDGCTVAWSWTGFAHDVVSDLTVEVTLSTQVLSSEACPPPPEPTAAVTGSEPTLPPTAPEPTPPPNAPTLTLPPTDIASGPTGKGSAPIGLGMVLICAIGGAFVLLGVRRATK